MPQKVLFLSGIIMDSILLVYFVLGLVFKVVKNMTGLQSILFICDPTNKKWDLVAESV